MNSVKALFVANYAIEIADDVGEPFSNYKLQKILYLLQARHLLEKGTTLFTEPLLKWKSGPIVKSVYDIYKQCGAFPIAKETIATAFVDESSQLPFPHNVVEYSPDALNDFEKELIKDTVVSTQDFSTSYLSEKIKEQPLWRLDEDKIMSGIQTIEYNNDEIKAFFENNPLEQLWIE